MKDKTNHQLKALIVDDDRASRHLLVRLAQKNDLIPCEADGGFVALTMFEREHYDIVLLDLIMPECDGLTVCRKLREKYSPNELPILVVTGQSEDSDLREALNAGANDYVQKPVNSIVFDARLTAQLRMLSFHRALRDAQEKIASQRRMQGIGLFATSVAHNFNNLLGTMYGSVDLLKGEVDLNNPNIGTALKLMELAVQRSAELVRGLLTFARPSESSRSDIREILSAAVPLLQASLDARLNYTIADDVPEVAISPVLLTQIILELLEAASQREDSSPHEIQINVNRAERDPDRVALSLHGVIRSAMERQRAQLLNSMNDNLAGTGGTIHFSETESNSELFVVVELPKASAEAQ